MYTEPLPYSTEIEKSVLGCILFDKKDMIARLDEKDFYNGLCQAVFKAMKSLYERNETVDIVTVSDALSDKLGNAYEYVSGIVLVPSNPQNFEYYLSQLKNYTTRREIIKAAYEAIKAAHESSLDAHDLKASVQQLMDVKTYETGGGNHTISSLMTRTMEDIENKFNAKDEEKLFTGFYDLDKITAGLHPEELTIIAARPGVGKTAFSLQILINLAHKRNSCLFVSREMSDIQLAKRLLSNIAVIDGHKLRFCKALTDSDWAKMGPAVEYISALPVEINDFSTVQEIRAYCRELKNKGNLDVLIVDYIGLVHTMKKCETRKLELGDISRQFKEISMEFRIPVVVLCQLNREVTKQNEPDLHNLSESGNIEQDADNVIFLHVPKDADETQDNFDIKIMLSKQRNGPTGHIWLKYYKKTFKFVNVR